MSAPQSDVHKTPDEARGLGSLIANIGTIEITNIGTSPGDEPGIVPEISLRTAGWRIEVLNGNSETNRYWIWRKGSRDKRKSAYGGTFKTLSAERQAEWEKNRKAHPSRSAGDPD